jgi:hypothetical protein
MIPAVNIAIAFSREAINKFFLSENGIPSIIKDAEEDSDLVLFNNVSNPNFISLTHNFKGEKTEIKLEFIDPNSEFEKRLITGNISELLSSVFKNEAPGSYHPTETAEVEKAKQGTEEYSNFYNAYMKAMIEKAGETRLYIAYGVGENTDYWAGPLICTLQSINITIKGNRKFTMTLVPIEHGLGPDNRTGLFTNQAHLNLEGLSYIIKGKSAVFDFANLLQGTVDDSLFWIDDQRPRVYQSELYDLGAVPDGVDKGLAKETEQQRSAQFLARSQTAAAKLTQDLDFHLIITDVIRDYIRKVTRNPNVIVLLPDLNVILADFIQETANNNAQVFQDPTTGPLVLTPEEQELFSIYASVVDNEDSYRLNRIPWLFFYAVARSVLESFDINFEAINRSTWNRTALPPPEFAVEEDKQFNNYQERTEKYVLDQLFFASLITSDRKIPNHKETLQKLIDNIWKSSKGRDYGKFVLSNFFESDLNLLTYWEEINSPAFGGARDFTSNKSAVIFGDRELIKQYLYGVLDDDVTLGIPLHPLDAACFHKSYRKEVRDITRKGIQEIGPFGDPTYLPDDFMHVENELVVNPQLKKDLRERNIPVFRYNTSNPNVSEIKFKFSPEYFAEMSVAIQKQIERRAANNFGGIINSRYSQLNLSEPNDVIAYITSRHLQLGKEPQVQDTIIEELKTRFEGVADDANIDPEEHAKAYYALYRELLNDPDKPIIQVAQLVDADPVRVVADMAEQLYRNALQMEITTLPAYYLSNYSKLGTPVLLLAQDGAVMQTKTNRSTILDSFFSGLYTLVGWSHKITSTGAISQLNLIKMVSKANEPKPANEKQQDDMELPQE